MFKCRIIVCISWMTAEQCVYYFEGIDTINSYIEMPVIISVSCIAQQMYLLFMTSVGPQNTKWDFDLVVLQMTVIALVNRFRDKCFLILNGCLQNAVFDCSRFAACVCSICQPRCNNLWLYKVFLNRCAIAIIRIYLQNLCTFSELQIFAKINVDKTQVKKRLLCQTSKFGHSQNAVDFL